MNYFSAYKNQVKAFYRTMGVQLFSKAADLDAPLAEDFRMKKGFFWEIIDVHLWLVRSIWMVIRNAFQLALCYFAAVFIIMLMLLTPIGIMVVFPYFCYSYNKMNRKRADQL